MSKTEHEPDWRDRLRAAVKRTGKKHSYLAREAGIAPETLSRILKGRTHPRFETVVRIAHVCGEAVGAMLGEQYLSDENRRRLDFAAAMIGLVLFDRGDGPPATPRVHPKQ